MKKTTFLLIVAIALFSCSKTKKYSKGLGGEEWTAFTVTIDGQEISEHFILAFDECDLYDESCMGTWENENDGHTHVAEKVRFIWQFRENGKTFQLSNQTEGTHAVQASQLSGVYKVISMDKEHFEISSNSTVGYEGKIVYIKLLQGHSH